MATNYIAPTWRMPENSNQSKLSNYSLDFTGSQYVSTGAAGSFTTFNDASEASVSLFYRSSEVTGAGTYRWFFNIPNSVSGGTHGFSLYARSGKIWASVYTTSGQNDVDINPGSQTDGNWHHLVLTYKDGVGLRLYYDSVLQFTDTSETGNLSLDGELAIGTFSQAYGTSNAIAVMSDLSAFTYALSQDQVDYLYNLNNPMAITGVKPVLYYKLGDNSNPTSSPGYPNLSGGGSVFKGNYNEYIDTSFSTPAGSKTISIWFKVDTASGYQGLFYGSNTSSSMSIGAATSFVANIGLSWFANYTGVKQHIALTTGVTTYQDGEWHNMTYVYDGSTKFIYIDGQSQAITYRSGSGYSTDTSLDLNFENIKLGSNGLSGATDVLFSNAQVFNTALPATGSNSVETLYNNGSPLTSMSGFTSLQGWWKLDATEIYNSTSTEWSIDNNAYPSTYPSSLNFDGSDKIDLNSDIGLSGAAASTFSMWVNFASTTDGGLVVNSGPTSGSDGLFIYSNTLYFFVNNNVSATISSFSSVISTDEWYHICGVFSGGNYLKIYLNGVDTASTSTAQSTMSTSITNYVIGHNSFYGYFDGEISNVAIYNTALSASNVLTLYNNGTPQATIYGAPVAHYKLDNKTLGLGNSSSDYSTALDFSGDGNNSGVQIASDLMNGYTNFTWSIWANAKSFPDAANYLLKAGGQSYLRESAGNLNFFINIGGTFTPLSAGFTSTNEWSHIVGVVDQANSKMKIFINGVLKATRACGSGTIQTSSPFVVGTDNSLPLYVWDGLLSNAQVWNTALTDGSASTVGDVAGGEIATLYNSGNPLTSSIPQSSNNKLWWKMDNLTTGIQDSSGNSNDSTGISSEIVQVDSFVSTLNGTNNGATDYAGFVNTLAGESSGMNSTNLIQSTLSAETPYSNYSVEFNGTTDYFEIVNSSVAPAVFQNIGNSNNYSISTWINTTTTADIGSANYYWFAKSTILELRRERVPSTITVKVPFNLSVNGGKLFFGRSSNYTGDSEKYESTADVNTGTWVHCVITVNNNTLTFYINGSVDSTHTFTTATGDCSVGTDNVNFNIGARSTDSGASDAYFGAVNGTATGGKISNTAIWNVQLTSTEIAEIYNAGVPTDLNSFSGTAPIAWYPMDGKKIYYNGSVIVARDAINTNDATGINLIQENIEGNAPGSRSNGIGSGLTAIYLKGDMKTSTKNAYSINMADYGDPNSQGVTPANSGRTTSVPG